MTFPSCAGPSAGGETRTADMRTGNIDFTFASYVFQVINISDDPGA